MSLVFPTLDEPIIVVVQISGSIVLRALCHNLPFQLLLLVYSIFLLFFLGGAVVYLFDVIE